MEEERTAKYQDDWTQTRETCTWDAQRLPGISRENRQLENQAMKEELDKEGGSRVEGGRLG